MIATSAKKIMADQVAALRVGEVLRLPCAMYSTVVVIHGLPGFHVDGTCPAATAPLVESDFRATDWAPEGVMYLWGRRLDLSATEAVALAERLARVLTRETSQ